MPTPLTVGSIVANDRGVARQIKDRLSQELVIAFVRPVGSGVSTAAAYVRNILTGDFKYDVAPILKPSDFIRSQCPLVGLTAPTSAHTATYISEMQDAGNALRRHFGNNYLIEKVVERIRAFRTDREGYKGEIELPGRRAYIIDSLKNIEELELLKDIYNDSLCVIGVFAPDSMRGSRLKDIGYEEGERRNVMRRDQAELMTFGQATRKLFVHSDFFVCNDRRLEDLEFSLRRFTNIVFDTEIHTPTRAESAMYEADAAAASSACMSRQVGASIVSDAGELIAVGWNDVPKFGGSLYSEGDRASYDEDAKSILNKDHRCYNWSGGKCHNETRRNDLIESVTDAVRKTGSVQLRDLENIRLAVSKTNLNSLIEFSRSIHAEMEAILSVAREGKHSLMGATLYTNTYPCHNCARHIVAAGIKTVIYIEPYLKSLAIELHSDVISELPDARNMVIFRQFDGVAPHNYIRLFRPKAARKQAGILSRPARETALPIFRVPLDAKRDYEDKVIADVAAKEQNLVRE